MAMAFRLYGIAIPMKKQARYSIATLLDHNKFIGRQLEEAKTSLQEANIIMSKANGEIEALNAKNSKLKAE